MYKGVLQFLCQWKTTRLRTEPILVPRTWLSLRKHRQQTINLPATLSNYMGRVVFDLLRTDCIRLLHSATSISFVLKGSLFPKYRLCLAADRQSSSHMLILNFSCRYSLATPRSRSLLILNSDFVSPNRSPTQLHADLYYNMWAG